MDERQENLLFGLDEWLEQQIVPRCIVCGKTPEEIDEYQFAVEYEENMTPSEFVKKEEGTYNPKNGHFTCTSCYFHLGAPASPTGWTPR